MNSLTKLFNGLISTDAEFEFTNTANNLRLEIFSNKSIFVDALIFEVVDFWGMEKIEDGSTIIYRKEKDNIEIIIHKGE